MESYWHERPNTRSSRLQRALRRAARRSLLWAEEAEEIIKDGRSLTELPGIGPYLNRQIVQWLEHPPDLGEAIPEIRRNFLTLAEARRMRSREPERFAGIRGDLQMHTAWSDGSGSIQDMADAAAALGYSYLAITDHSKGLKIAGGINEDQLAQQAEEIETVNGRMPRRAGSSFYRVKPLSHRVGRYGSACTGET